MGTVLLSAKCADKRTVPMSSPELSALFYLRVCTVFDIICIDFTQLLTKLNKI